MHSPDIDVLKLNYLTNIDFVPIAYQPIYCISQQSYLVLYFVVYLGFSFLHCNFTILIVKFKFLIEQYNKLYIHIAV